MQVPPQVKCNAASQTANIVKPAEYTRSHIILIQELTEEDEKQK
jgi:hypothetical protein